jgi:hypothetical protein
MCRSIVTLRGEETASDDEVRAAALQFVRKVSGFRVPSKNNADVFERAVSEVTAATRSLLDELVTPPGARQPAMARSRIVAREKAAARAASAAATGGSRS